MENATGTAYGLDLVLAVWRRRKWPVLFVFAALASVGFALARSLPDVYESTATVLVEQQQVPERFVGPSVTGGLDVRLQTISQEILSRSRLDDLIARYGLYPTMREKASPEMLAEQMRRDIHLEFTEAREPTGQGATIAFTISYRGRDPQTVAEVTNALAALFVERNASMREQQTAGTIAFLQAQLKDVQQRLDAQEQRVNQFKERYSGELPEQQGANLAALQRLNAQLSLNLDGQRRLMDQQSGLLGQGTGVSGSTGSSDDLSARLAKLRQELADLRTRYTDEHPDVVRVRSEIAALERQLAAAPARAGAQATAPEANPGQPKGPLARVDADLAALKTEERTLRRVIADYEQRVENGPRRAQELQQISGDYDALKGQYQSLRQRSEDAQLAERAAQGQQGEQFRILDPAVPALRPVGPHRFRLLLAGLMLAAAAAGGVAMLAEARDTSFHTVDDVRAFTRAPVLVSIPPIVTRRDTRRRRWRFWLAAAATAVGVAAVASASSYLAGGNDALVRLLTPVRFF